MDSTVLLSLVGGVLLLSIIFATGFCTYCWGYKQPTSISQRSSDSTPEYNQSSSQLSGRVSSQSSVGDSYMNIEEWKVITERESDVESDHNYENVPNSSALRTPSHGLSRKSVSSDEYVNTLSNPQ
ncbi:hypothetical protein DNTS_017846 [Danionella cerebrum]|nr:hypothetical protein DNTS_017846 [Danionella translucida]